MSVHSKKSLRYLKRQYQAIAEQSQDEPCSLPEYPLDSPAGGEVSLRMTYYSQKLAGARLKRVYEIAPKRVQQYLDAEVTYVAGQLQGGESALELGCGYGRVMFQLAHRVANFTGIDTAEESILLGKSMAADFPNCRFLAMDATQMSFEENSFDLVICIQNGICAFRVDQMLLIREAMRVTKPGGVLLFSTYSSRFWTERLNWFELQAGEGLVGPIDHTESGDGTIVCTDGFRSGSLSRADFIRLGERIGSVVAIEEVDQSSLFCKFVKPIIG